MLSTWLTAGWHSPKDSRIVACNILEKCRDHTNDFVPPLDQVVGPTELETHDLLGLCSIPIGPVLWDWHNGTRQ